METIFSLVNLLVLPFWALMIFAPFWRWTERIIRSPWIALPPAVVYALLLGASVFGLTGGTNASDVMAGLANPTAAGIGRLLGTPFGATVAWAHFLAFDLLVGRWVFLEARSRRLTHWLTAPILFLTFMLGPLGLLTFLLVRSQTSVVSSQKADVSSQRSEDRSQRSAESYHPGLLLRRAWQANKPLTFYSVAIFVVLAFTVVGLFLDPRVITGQPAWLKPTKFALSTAIYSFTLVWLLTFVQGHRRLVGMISWVVSLGFVLEMVIIIGQVMRGTTSHFNIATPLDATLFSIMGSMIVVVWVMTVIAAVLLLRQRLPDPVLALALRLSLVIVLIGSAEGFFMTNVPSPAQRATIEAGRAPSSFGAHSVGVEDGGRGMPITGWSLEGGDLRIAHFVGLHAMQVLPFAAWWINRRFRRLGQSHRVGLIWTVSLGYLGLVALLTWQALRGEPLVYPDGLTLGALAALGAGVALAGMAIVAHGETRARALVVAGR